MFYLFYYLGLFSYSWFFNIYWINSEKKGLRIVWGFGGVGNYVIEGFFIVSYWIGVGSKDFRKEEVLLVKEE